MCLSQFLLLVLLSRQICNVYAPGFPHLPQFNSCNWINYWLRDRLHPDAAQVHAQKFVMGDKFIAPINLVPRHAQC